MSCIITRFRDVIPEGRIKLVLCLHDFGEELRLTFFIKRWVTAKPEKRIFVLSNKEDVYLTTSIQVTISGLRSSSFLSLPNALQFLSIQNTVYTHKMYVMTPIDQQSTALL